MTVRTLIVENQRRSFRNWREPTGNIRLSADRERKRACLVHDGTNLEGVTRLLTIGVRCNHAVLKEPRARRDGWRVFGDPTSVLRLPRPAATIWPCRATVCEFPFDSKRKAMSLVTRRDDGGSVMHAKGATEAYSPDARGNGGTAQPGH
ncbi:MAG: hypothetical protein U1D30_20165 [Planctomycetota bacterium]